MFGFLKRKKELEKLKKEVQDSFNHVKDDFTKVGKWIEHIDGKHTGHENELDNLKEEMQNMKDDLNEIKDFISFCGPQILNKYEGVSKQLSKQHQGGVQKQTGVQGVQTAVQTAVQTGILGNLTIMERGIIWALINSGDDMKLSYDDLAALLGKNKSTIRGQINALKQKREGLVEEYTEKGGKKRIYIPEQMRDFIVKSVKVRVNNSKKSKKKRKK